MELKKAANFFKRLEPIDFGIVFVIIAGIFIRTKLLFINESFWYDTCALAANLQKSYPEFWHPLEYLQVAPAGFMMLSKFLCGLFWDGENIEQRDFILRLIPYFSSLAALIIMPFLAKKIFNNKYLILASTAMLSLNSAAIYFSREFKPYSSDILITMLLLLAFANFSLNKISVQKLTVVSLFSGISVLFSNTVFITLFPVCITICTDLFKQKCFPFKKLLLFITPICITFIPFYLMYKEISDKYGAIMLSNWDKIEAGFISGGNFFDFFTEKFNLITGFPVFINSFVLFLVCATIFWVIKRDKTVFICLFPIITTILLCAVRIYPFEKRVSVFLLPALIIVCSVPALFIKKNKIADTIILIIIVLISFCEIKNYPEKITYAKSNVRELVCILKQTNPEFKNVISQNELFEYYAGKKCDYSIKLSSSPDFADSEIPNLLSDLPNGEYSILLASGTRKYKSDLEKYINSAENIEVLNVYKPKSNKTNLLARIKIIRHTP